LSSSQPIGVFDSGVGGLSVVRQILTQLPNENIVYVGDTARVPYGPRPVAEIIAFGCQIIDFLTQFDVKVVVAACNTSSSVSLTVLRQQYGALPVLGVVEPGVRAVLRATKNRRIGVLATVATVNSGAYQRHILEHDPGATVLAQSCPQFVPLVEAGRLDGSEVRAAAGEYLQPLLQAGVDSIVLGCTHYPFLAPVIGDLAGEGVTIVDPAEETVKELAVLLASQTNTAGRDERVREAHPAPADPIRAAKHRFFASGDPASFYSSGKQCLGDFPFEVEQAYLRGSRLETRGERIS
jgi:glutamate racemase